jgi:DNA-binding CsgD family transcriptional regulator
VKTHLGNIYRKLGVERRTQAVVVALQKKLLD